MSKWVVEKDTLLIVPRPPRMSGRQWRKYRQFLKRGYWPTRRRDRV